ncbi:MAG: isoprenylcysteine carboxylmethyltransferase family protein, partial [Candidatus Acidiferrales bacterium]
SANKSGASGLISRWFRVSVVAVGAGVLVWVFRNRPLTPARIAGICLMISGLTLWFVAQFQLGDSFSVQPKARHLVTHGLYSRIRNPIYVFSSILLVGMLLFFGWPELMLPVLTAIVVMQLFRARAEARVLEEKFGDEYREYRRKTWF